ncbi:MAG: GNAT family N-acetyltransferase [Candidatus Peregrinibacteria bacterium]
MSATLHLRPVTQEDSRLLWEWANDPVVRAVSFSTDVIPWDKHEQWLKRKLQDEHCRMYIALNEESTPVGQIRFDIREDNEAEVDVHLAPALRGKGYGTALITEGLCAFFASSDAQTAHSFIKEDNLASRNVFLKAGFVEQKKEHMHEQEVYHFTYKHS